MYRGETERVLKEFVDLFCDRIALDTSGMFSGIDVDGTREAVHDYIRRGEWKRDLK